MRALRARITLFLVYLPSPKLGEGPGVGEKQSMNRHEVKYGGDSYFAINKPKIRFGMVVFATLLAIL